ncbi:MAG: hypothetical protein GX801_03245 [Fibrobacter sp.]|nr:hypothetical protein [Fibrobacter sp.]
MFKHFLRKFWWFSGLIPLVSCLFNESGNASEWIEKQKYPTTYKTEHAKIALQAQGRVNFDSLPFQASVIGAVGSDFGSTQQAWYMVITNDTISPNVLKGADSVQSFLKLRLDSLFYKENVISPLFSEDSITVELSWSNPQEISKSQRDSVRNINDSIWFNYLFTDFVRGSKAQKFTQKVLAPAKVQDSLMIPLPTELSAALATQKSRLQFVLGVNIPEAERIYRFSGPSNVKNPPCFSYKAFYGEDSVYYRRSLKDSVQMRGAQSSSLENPGENLVIHGGVRETLWVELPGSEIMRVLDSISPRSETSDSIDAHRFVLMAQLELAAPSDPQGGELSMPLPVLAAAQIPATVLSDTMTLPEAMILDSLNIKESGHSNLLFYHRDTINLQITETLRHFVQVADFGINPEFSLTLGRPMLSPKEVHNSDYRDSDTSWVRIYSNFPSYASWELGKSANLDVNLHIWWVNRQGGDE